MHTVSQALADILARIPRCDTETVPLTAAAGRVLRQDARARVSHPGATVSAMDGYALRGSDAVAGGRLRVIARVAAGEDSNVAPDAGEAVRVLTGSRMPANADTVAIQEIAAVDGDWITLAESVETGAFVRQAGLDFREGDILLESPRRISPEDVALAAAMNLPRLEVSRPPRVLILPTGDELVPPGADPGPAQVVASSGYGLAALFARWGAEPVLLPPVPDNPSAIRDRLLNAEVDLLVTLGGASVGDRDFIGRILAQDEMELAFHGVAMRPGKPLLAGRFHGIPMVGLPGNPVSAMVCGHVFLRPAVEVALGLPATARPRVRATLATGIPAGSKRDHYLRVRLKRDGDELLCTPFPEQDSSVLRNLSAANALAIQPAGAPARAAGERIECMELQ